ncbi:MAG TPA: SGNH/GDSL hydrolase family protein [Dokdonella sp.]
MHARWRTSAALCAAALLLALTPAAPADGAAADGAHWVATWTASPERRWDGDFPLPTNLPFTVWDQTLRQTVRASVGGRRLRIALSNAYGDAPLRIDAAHVALSAGGAALVAGSDRTLRFGGSTAVAIAPGASVLSDPVELEVAALAALSVSLNFAVPTPPATFHWDARATAYLIAGDHAGDAAFVPEATLTTRVFVDAVLVEAPARTRAVVAFGDSITDGNGSTVDADARWPDALARRLAPRGVAVLNAGISGNRLLRERMGASALARFDRDVLDPPGAAAAIVLIGINDIAWSRTPFAPDEPATSADMLVAGYRQLVARAHVRGLRIAAGTLTPFEGALHDTPFAGYYDADKERVRQAVNRWLRTSGEFDVVIDFDALLRDPARPTRLLPAYDSGDHLHPGDAGYAAMADAIDAQALLDGGRSPSIHSGDAP